MDNRPFNLQFCEHIQRVGLKNSQLAEKIQVQPETISRWRTGESIPNRRNLIKCIEPLEFTELENGLTKFNELLESAKHLKLNTKEQKQYFPSQKTNFDWGDRPEAKYFIGRNNELKDLEKWIVQDKCRLVSIVGIGGAGKTCLSVEFAGVGKTELSSQLAEKIADKFDYVIWRGLKDIPPITYILSDIIKFLSDQKYVETSEPNLNILKNILLKYLKEHHCLIIFDNVEDIFHPEKLVGEYRDENSAKYGNLFKTLGEVAHKSCLLLNSRINPPEIEQLANDYEKQVHIMPLSGINDEDGRKIFNHINKNFVNSSELDKYLPSFMENTKSNPFMLERLAETITQHFDGSVINFLAEQSNQSWKLDKFLENLFNHLSKAEQEIIYWITINREPVTRDELKDDMLTSEHRDKICDILLSLKQRFALGQNRKGEYLLQPIFIEYFTGRFIKKIIKEIETGNILFIHRYPLIKSTSKNYIRERQIDLILQPIWQQLVTEKGEHWLEQQLQQILTNLRKSPPAKGYTAGNILNLLCHNGSTDKIENYDFSQLYISQAYLQGKQLHNIDFSYAEFDRTSFTETFGSTLCVAFSPNGKFLATGDVHNKVHLWERQNRKYNKTLTGHGNWVWSVAFSPDSEFLASTDTGHAIKLWKWNQEKNSYNFYKTMKDYYSVWSVSITHQTVATGNDQGVIVLWDIETGQCLGTLHGHDLAIWCVTFSPTGKLLASSSSDKTIKIWDYHKQKCLQTLTGHKDFIRSVDFSPDEKLLVSGSDDTTVKVWDLETGKYIYNFSLHNNIVRSVIFNPNGYEIISGSDDGQIRIWNIKTGKPKQTLSQNSMVSSIDIDPKTGQIVAGYENQSIGLWKENQRLHTWQGYTTLAGTVSFSPDDKILASTHDDRVIRLWNIKTGKCIKTLIGHKHIIWQAIFSLDGKLLASGSSDKTIKIWNLKTGKCLKTLETGNNNWIFVVVFTHDDKFIIAAGTDYTVKIWEVATGRLVKILKGHTSLIAGIALNPKIPNILASVSADRTIRVWNIDTGNCIKILPIDTSADFSKNIAWIPKVDFSNDGQILAASRTNTKLFNICKDYKFIKELPGRMVTLIPNKNFMISIDKNIKIWNIHSGECFIDLPKEQVSNMGDIWFMELNHNSTKIAAVHEGGDIKIWGINMLTRKTKLLKTLYIPKPYEGTNITGIIGLNDAQKISLMELGASYFDELD